MAGTWSLELTGFGVSLEQPTASEHTSSTAAKARALMLPRAAVAIFLALMFLPQTTESRDATVLRKVLMRVMVVASCRVAAL
jgi:hypothetical protein